MGVEQAPSGHHKLLRASARCQVPRIFEVRYPCASIENSILPV